MELQLVPTVVSRKNFFHFMLLDENDIIKDQAHNQILHIKPKSIIKVNLGTSCLSFLGTWNNKKLWPFRYNMPNNYQPVEVSKTKFRGNKKGL